jgi:diguanylate cyclase (GGDEF)-like protein
MLLMEMYLPDMTGIEVLEKVKAQHPSTDVILSTGYASVDTAVQALKKGASDYLRKPYPPEELAAAVRNIIEQRHLYHINEDLRNRLRLYEISRSFVAAEEPLRVLTLGVDSLCEMLGIEQALGICIDPDEDALTPELKILEVRGEGPRTNAELLPGVIESFGEHLLGKVTSSLVVEGELFDHYIAPMAPRGSKSALVVPITVDEVHMGAMILFAWEGLDGFDVNMVRDAGFLGGQITLAFKQASRFQEAKSMAYIDSLTDLYNAKYLPIILEKRLADAKQMSKPLSLLFLDLDNFRDINTRYGHQAGGKALIEIAWILQANVRDNDTVIRYGGDEFTVVLPEADTDSARVIAERIRKQIETHVFLGRENKNVRVTVCIGVATYPDDTKSAEMLIHLADKAMYRGKDSTRNMVVLARDGIE